MSKDKQVIGTEDVGPLEELLGPNDPLFQPEPKQETKEWVCPRCGHVNSSENETCKGHEMSEYCLHPKPTEEHETDSDGNLLGLG